jgi:hypothetical protein
VIALCTQLQNELFLVEPEKDYAIIEEARFNLSERVRCSLFCELTDRLFLGQNSQLEIVDMTLAQITQRV